MFSFLKRKKQAVVTQTEVESLTAEDVEKISESIQKIQTEILNIPDSNRKKLAESYERLGVLQGEIAIDQSIESLEKSMSFQTSIGPAYKTLMRLYNQKRSEAAHKGEGEEIEKWLGKMDQLRQIARNNTINSN